MQSTSTLGIFLIRYSNSVGVAFSRRRYPNANPSLPICRGIIQLSITPTAKRNSYRVAKIVGAATQGREAPPQPSPKGGSTTKQPKTQQEGAPAPWGGLGRGFYPHPQPSPEGGSTAKPLKTQQEGAPAPWGGLGRGFQLSSTPLLISFGVAPYVLRKAW